MHKHLFAVIIAVSLHPQARAVEVNCVNGFCFKPPLASEATSATMANRVATGILRAEAVPSSQLWRVVDPKRTDPADASKLLALAPTKAAPYGTQLVRSVDGGKSWKVEQFFPTSAPQKLAVSDGGQRICIGYASGLSCSKDGGKTFANVPVGAAGACQNISGGLQFLADGRLVVAASLTSPCNTAVKSGTKLNRTNVVEFLDKDFRKIPGDSPGPVVDPRFAGKNSSPGWLQSLAVSPDGKEIYAGGSDYVFRWNGKKWTRARGMLDTQAGSAVADIVHVKGVGWMATTCNGIYVQDPRDPDNWPAARKVTDANRSFVFKDDGWNDGSWRTGGKAPVRSAKTLRAYDLAQNPDNPRQLCTGADTGVYCSDDLGQSWRKLDHGSRESKRPGGLTGYRDVAFTRQNGAACLLVSGSEPGAKVECLPLEGSRSTAAQQSQADE
jgi:hypothetical protein